MDDTPNKELCAVLGCFSVALKLGVFAWEMLDQTTINGPLCMMWLVVVLKNFANKAERNNAW